LSAEELIAVNVDVCSNGFYGAFVFAPVVDGTLIRGSPSEFFKQGKVNTVSFTVRCKREPGVFYVG
jgi:carboxylesterase type B